MRRFLGFFLVTGVTLLIHSFILFRLPSVEVIKYSHAADLLLQGKLLGERLLDFSPLYLLINTTLARLGATSSILLWIHIIASALSAGLLFGILRQHFRKSVAMIGTAAFILDRSLLVYTHTFEPEPIVMVLIIAATFFATQRTSKTALAGGLFFGLGILTRPNFVPVLLAVPFFYKTNSVEKHWIKNTVLFLIPALFCLGGLWFRNARIVEYFSPVVMNPGTALYEGNNPNSQGTSSVYPSVLNQLSLQYSNLPDYHHQLYRDFARKITGKNLTIPQVNSYWTGKALQFSIDHPARTVRLLSTKILHFFHSYMWHDLSAAYTTEQTLKKIWPFRLSFAILSAFALLGLIILSPNWERYLFFYVVFLSQFLFMMAIYVSARQRISVLFLFIFFACGTLQFILENRRRWLALLFVTLLFIPLYIRTDFMSEEDHLWESIRRSNGILAEAYRLRNKGKVEEASQKAAQALAVAPWLYDSRRPANLAYTENPWKRALTFTTTENTPAQRMDRAVLLLESGRSGEAESIFRKLDENGYRLKRDHYQSSEYQFYVARCALNSGERSRALGALEKAIQRSPGDPFALSYLAVLTGDSRYEKQLFRYFDNIEAAFLLGKAHLETGNAAEAVQRFQYVTRMLPEFRKSYVYLAASLSDAGRYEEGAITYRKAISLSADPVFEEQRILKIFEQLVLTKATGWNYYSYGVVLRQFGHFDKALEEQEKAVAKDPSNAGIRAEIGILKKVISLNKNK